MIYTTSSFEETQKLGEDFAQKAINGAVLALHGNLGSGKTTFVQGFAKGLGITKNIISPTFIIVRKYNIPKSLIFNLKSFYHIDLYRIENQKDLESLGIEEIINDKSNIVAIEWPEKIEKLLPKTKIDIFFEYLKDDKRSIKIQ